ncbi:GNAT family N-acetyltransferase [Paracoccus sp. IB05]|uniref:GNAT family N-acetyltransferase n=1 Tax=Paracoccus sp. IB05 TaxID=2779367 RepID=UPI0018E72BF1|nr:GNAT family N-acetyltransferase [Paracoccus sp. IB05]MBJ2152627.1 GNAT family N-acetyltransferase [Paracoccus sp. IB05]
MEFETIRSPGPYGAGKGIAAAAASVEGVSDRQIAAGRFILRPVRASDAGLIAHYAGDKRVADATQNIPHPFPPGAAEAYVNRSMNHDRPGSVWVMDGAAHGLSELLGVISLKPMEVKAGRSGQSEVAYWVAPVFWNTGIASEAVRALVAANPLEDSTYFAEVFQDNPGSARVLTNAGFEYLGDAEAFSVARNAIVPTWTYIRKMVK